MTRPIPAYMCRPCDDLGPFVAGPTAAALHHIINPQLVHFSPVTQDRARGFTAYCTLYNKHIGEHRDWLDFCRCVLARGLCFWPFSQLKLKIPPRTRRVP